MRSTRPDRPPGHRPGPARRERTTSPPAPGRAAGPARRTRVLIVEDESALLRALRIDLRARGYDVVTATTGHEALEQAAARPPDAVLLDLGLPDTDGAQVIRQLRAHSAVPVIVLSGRIGVPDKIGALDAGADDYVTKPFSVDELVARLRAALRRDAGPESVVRLGDFDVDLASYTIVRVSLHPPGTPDEPPVRLTPTEWRLLEILLRSPGRLVPASRLLAEVWGAGFEHHAHYLRFHMARLRRKLELDPPRPRHLLTEPGMGYRYQP